MDGCYDLSLPYEGKKRTAIFAKPFQWYPLNQTLKVAARKFGIAIIIFNA